MLSVDVAPCQWRRESNMYSVKRMGYLLLSFFDMTEEGRIDSASKKTFVITAKNMDIILALDAKAPYSESDSNEELMLYKQY